jgi:hypothetical protein
MRTATVVLAALFGAAASAALGAGNSAKLTFAGGTALTVHGTHFAPSERVRVKFSTGDTSKVVVIRANQHGTFLVTAPPSVAGDGCGSPFVVSAAGVNGDSAFLHMPRRMCPMESPTGSATGSTSSSTASHAQPVPATY